jgi:hypothetical protein
MNGSLEPLLGTWRGSGEGTWPTSGPFRYDEEIVFEDGGGGEDFAFVAYRERAWDPGTGTTMHAERGFWRVHDGGHVDVTFAHPIGVTEIAEGSFDGSTLGLVSHRIGRSENGLPVVGLSRVYQLEEGRLSYEIDLATNDVPMMQHLHARLERA